MGRERPGVGMEKKKKKKVGGGQEIGPFKWERCFLKNKKKKREKKNWGVHFQLVGGYCWKHA